jgi:methyl-accepting chemotaxis protein
MNFNETMERALEQARQLQQSISDALNKAAEQLKPQIEGSLKTARDLQATLTKHAEASSELATKNTQVALEHLHDYMNLGVEALHESAEQTRVTAQKMVEQSRKVVEAAAAAVGKRLE